MKGYKGKILRVDLSTRKARNQELTKELALNYIGGSGIGAKILYDEVKQYTHPLISRENLLIFMTGPLTGTLTPSSGRYSVISKSPLTWMFCDSNSSGFFGPQLKKSGYDGIVFKGISEKPVYIILENSNAEIKDANHLWGKDTHTIEDILKKDYGKNARIASIGQAGENQSYIACIINDKNRAAGRGGLGAVMGSKKLKAIVALGGEKIEVHKQEAYKTIREKANTFEKITQTGAAYSSMGTPALFDISRLTGDLPVKNWGLKNWDGIDMNEAKEILSMENDNTCFNCIIKCGKKALLNGKETAWPEYETIASLGSLCLNDDIKSISHMSDLCNKYGLDTISTGSVIAFAMECSEKNLIKEKIKWADSEKMIELIKRIANKQDILANKLSNGVHLASVSIPNSEEFAITVKNMEVPMHDPRAFKGMALAYMTSTRGACHLKSPMIVFGLTGDMPEFKLTSDKSIAYANKTYQDWNAVLDSLGICKFAAKPQGGLTAKDVSYYFIATTGIKITPLELLKAGERIYNTERCFNINEGVKRKDDKLPKRLLKKRKDELELEMPDLENLLDQYYEMRGWDKQGIPKKEKLEELEIS